MRPRWLTCLIALSILSACSATESNGSDKNASSISKGGAQSPGASQSAPSEPEAQDNLTRENNKKLAALLAGPESGKNVETFSEKYRTKTIAFDAHVESIGPGGVKNWYNYLILAGDQGESPSTGPNFQISGDPTYKGSYIPKNLRRGQNIRISALVGEYEIDIELFHLVLEKPGSIKRR